MVGPVIDTASRCAACGHYYLNHRNALRHPCLICNCEFFGQQQATPSYIIDESRRQRQRKVRWVASRYDLPLVLVALMYSTIVLSMATWWILKNSAIGTAYGCQVWWWILTGRGDPLELALDEATT